MNLSRRRGFLFKLQVLLVCIACHPIVAHGLEGWFDSRFLKNALKDPSLIYFHRLAYFWEDLTSFVGLSFLLSARDFGSCVDHGRWYKVDPEPTGLFQWSPPPTFRPRLEHCFVYVQKFKRAYLIGGVRTANFPIDIYDPVERRWTTGTGPGVQIDHFNCVTVDDKIWIPTAWNHEVGIDKVYVYDPATDTWDMTSREGLPPARQRGGAATVAVDRDIYVLFGNQGGHKNGTSVAWADKYNIDTDTWTTLPDGLYGRDHTGGGLVHGRICVAGGRIATKGLGSTVLPTECLDPVAETWEIEADFPGRGTSGSAYGMTCDGQLMLAGGEYNVIADSHVYTFDGTKWTEQTRLRLGRHGTQLATVPDCNQIIMPAGSSERGSGFMLESTDIFFGNGKKEHCSI